MEVYNGLDDQRYVKIYQYIKSQASYVSTFFKVKQEVRKKELDVIKDTI